MLQGSEQVQKLVTSKECFKDDSPKDNILIEKAVKNTILPKIITVLTRYRPIVLELI